MQIELKTQLDGLAYYFELISNKLIKLDKDKDIDKKIKFNHTFFYKDVTIKTTTNPNNLEKEKKKFFYISIGTEIKRILKKDKCKIKEIEEILTRANNNRIQEYLEEINKIYNRNQKIKILNEFLNTIRHEITNPITGIQLASNYIRSTGSNNEKNEINNDIILATTKITHFIQKRNPSLIISTNKIIKSVVKLFNNLHKNIQFDLNLNEELKLKDNSKLFEIIITNLIENSIQASTDCQNLKIIISTTKQNEKLKILFYDNCPPPKKPNLIFQPYYTTKKEGSGLGLYICKKYCIDLGFTIYYEAKPKKCFILMEL